MNQECRRVGMSILLVAAGSVVGWISAMSREDESLVLIETPPAIQTAISARVDPSEITSIERIYDGWDAVYEVHFVRENEEAELTFAPDGSLVEHELIVFRQDAL